MSWVVGRGRGSWVVGVGRGCGQMSWVKKKFNKKIKSEAN